MSYSSSAAAVITPELLDALLTATSGPVRTEAERSYQSVPIHDRVSALASILLGSSASGSAVSGRAALAAVLLRRDVSSLGLSSSTSRALSLNLLRDMSGPLLSAFLHPYGAGRPCGGDDCIRRLVGHCISEVCSSMSMLSSAEGDVAMGAALNGIGPGCAAANIPSLRLLADLADRAPLSFWRTSGRDGEIIFSLFRSSIGALNAGAAAASSVECGGDTVLAKCDAILEAMVNIGIASGVATSASDAAESTNDLLVMIRARAEDVSGRFGGGVGGAPSVDTYSAAASLGEQCLPAIFSALMSPTSDHVDVRMRCLRHLSHAASKCPSLLAGKSTATVGVVVESCLSIARAASSSPSPFTAANGNGWGYDEALSALELLASMCEVDDIRLRIVQPYPSGDGGGHHNLLRLLLLGGENNDDDAVSGNSPSSDRCGVIWICLKCIVNGVDDDIDSWLADPVSLQHEDALSWDGDDAATYAESLLEIFLRRLGGGATTLPVVLPLVEAMLSSDGGRSDDCGLANHSWRYRRAALSILERCVDAAPVAFGPYMPVAVETALRLAEHDSCPRVQFQAVQLLGALCNADDSMDSSSVRGQYGGRILQALTLAVRSSCSKVSAHASLAIVSYCRGGGGGGGGGGGDDRIVDKDLLVPYLPQLVAAFLMSPGPLSIDLTNPACVSRGGVAALVHAISAVACVADAAGEDFASYYESIMPGLISCAGFGIDFEGGGLLGEETDGAVVRIAPNANGHDYAALRGSAIEAATIVAQAVGERDDPDNVTFAPDAEAVMRIVVPLLRMAERGADASSVVPMDQLLAASARVASVVGESFAPFVPAVLPHLLKRAREEAEVSVLEGDEAGLEATRRGESQYDEDAGTESVTVALPGMGIRKIVMNTTQMQEKAQAARAVFEHAAAMGAAFGPHTEPCLSALLPLVEFKYSAEVRSTASQAIAAVFNSLCEYAAAEKSAAALPNQALPIIAKAIARQLLVEDSDDPEAVFALADSLSEVFYSAYRHTNDADGAPIAHLGAGDSQQVVVHVVEIAKACLTRRSFVIRAVLGMDGNTVPNEDELAQYEAQLQSEASQLTELVNTIGYNIKSLRESFVPIFDQIVAPFFGPFLLSPDDVRARVAAVCIFDDCVEYCGHDAATRYSAPLAVAAIAGVLTDAATDDDDDLRSASVYGLAQIARNAPGSVLDGTPMNQIMGRLVQIVQGAEDIDDTYLVESAVSAIASLALFESAPYGGLIPDKSSLLDLFLGSLPLREVESEAQACHDLLCDLIANRSIDIKAESTRLIHIIGQIFVLVEEGKDVASAATCARLVAALKLIQSEVSSETVQIILAPMSPEIQSAVSKAVERQSIGRGDSPVSVVRMR